MASVAFRRAGAAGAANRDLVGGRDRAANQSQRSRDRRGGRSSGTMDYIGGRDFAEMEKVAGGVLPVPAVRYLEAAAGAAAGISALPGRQGGRGGDGRV